MEPPQQNDTRITLVGPTSSGKTHVAATVCFYGRAADDLLIGPDAPESAAFGVTAMASAVSIEPESRQLRFHYDGIRAANGAATPSSSKVVDHEFELHWMPKPQPPGYINKLLYRWGGKVRQQPIKQINRISLTDGPGKDLSGATYQEKRDQGREQRIGEYLKKFKNSQGVVICLPFETLQTDYSPADGVEIMDWEVDALEHVLSTTILRDPGRKIRSIALCLTMYENHFLNWGQGAADAAMNREEALKLVRNVRFEDMVRILAQIQADTARSERPVTVAVFPCSTYGFVNGNGAANYYPSKAFPGILTRKIEEDQFEAQPGLKDHFPVPLPESLVDKLWVPFNIAPPFYFAATGRITGPLAFDITEVVP